MTASFTYDQIFAYENGEMDEQEAIEFFQGLINTGTAWELQGAYGRTARMLILNGMCLTASEYAEGERVANEATGEV